MKHIHLRDPDSGDDRDYGAIAAKRQVDEFECYLSYCHEDKVWWIIVSKMTDGLFGYRLMGYLVERREECWEAFTELVADRQALVDMWNVPLDASA